MRTAGIDIGGTKVDVLVRNRQGSVPRYVQWPTSDFQSVEHVLDRAASIGTGGPIDRVAIAAAGRVDRNGSIRLTGLPWPVFYPNAFTTIVNDVQCAAGAMPTLGDHEYRSLNGVIPQANELIAVTASTGDNSAYHDTHGIVHPGETGHTGWQPWFDHITGHLSMAFLSYMQQIYPGHAVISVEDAISGDRGFDHLYNFVSQEIPPGEVMAEKVSLGQSLQKPLGPLVTRAAHKGDPCAIMCMQLWGPIFGQYLRERALNHLPRGGTIWLYGGVAQGEGVMDFIIDHTKFPYHFRGGQAKMHELMAQIALHLVLPSDGHPLTVRGALELA